MSHNSPGNWKCNEYLPLHEEEQITAAGFAEVQETALGYTGQE